MPAWHSQGQLHLFTFLLLLLPCIKLSLWLIMYHNMKTWVREGTATYILIWAPNGNWSASCLDQFMPGNTDTSTHHKVGWLGPWVVTVAVQERKNSTPAGKWVSICQSPSTQHCHYFWLSYHSQLKVFTLTASLPVPQADIIKIKTKGCKRLWRSDGVRRSMRRWWGAFPVRGGIVQRDETAALQPGNGWLPQLFKTLLQW